MLQPAVRQRFGGLWLAPQPPPGRVTGRDRLASPMFPYPIGVLGSCGCRGQSGPVPNPSVHCAGTSPGLFHGPVMPFLSPGILLIDSGLCEQPMQLLGCVVDGLFAGRKHNPSAGQFSLWA